jgi:hypothetical protein
MYIWIVHSISTRTTYIVCIERESNIEKSKVAKSRTPRAGRNKELQLQFNLNPFMNTRTIAHRFLEKKKTPPTTTQIP